MHNFAAGGGGGLGLGGAHYCDMLSNMSNVDVEVFGQMDVIVADMLVTLGTL